jgi:hypothetical protein
MATGSFQRLEPAPILNLSWPGWGGHSTRCVVQGADGALAAAGTAKKARPQPRRGGGHLGQVSATALSGNDLLSSCLYSAGQWWQRQESSAATGMTPLPFMRRALPSSS